MRKFLLCRKRQKNFTKKAYSSVIMLFLVVSIFTAALFAPIVPVFASAVPGELWERQTPPPGVELNDVTWSGSASQFIAVGDLETIFTSPDGTNWTVRRYDYTGQSGTLHGVAWGTPFPHAKYVAVGDGGQILTSLDCVTWIEQSSVTVAGLNDITWGNGRFVVVGWEGIILTSTNGSSWTERSSGTTFTLRGVTWGGGQFVAVGDSGKILTSTDGVTWTTRTSGTSGRLHGVTWGNGKFVAVGQGSTILTSSDAITWTAQDSPTNWELWFDQGTQKVLNDVVWSGNQFLIVGEKGAILSSPDGITWTIQYGGDGITALANNLNGVAWSGNQFVAVGGNGIIITSPPPGKNVDLLDLKLSSGSLNPFFQPDVTEYTAAVAHSVNTINVSIKLSDANSTVFWWTIGGSSYVTVAPGGLAGTVTLNEAGTATVIKIKVTANDGVTEKTYTVTVNRGNPPQQGTFPDVLPTHTHYAGIEAIAAANITRGYNDGTFRPSQPVTRAEMATFLARALNLPPGGQGTFPDVPPSHAHYANIEAIAAANITRGYNDGTFKPSQPVTRAEMATFLARALGLIN